MMKRLLSLFIIMLTIALSAVCVPAYPNKVRIMIESGDSVDIFLRGDEYNKYAVSMDGYLLAAKKDSWYYIKSDSASKITVSDTKISNSTALNRENEFLKAESSILSSLPVVSVPRYKRQPSYGPQCNALVILIEYSDRKFVMTKQQIEDLFNMTGYNDDGAQGSVRDFYHYASYGNFELTSNVYGPYISKYPMNYYGGNNIHGNDKNALELAVEAIGHLPDDIDLSVYDNDGNGVVDNVHIIFAGYGEEAGGPSYSIWSHEYPYSLPVIKNGYKFAGYSCTPELRSNMGNGISRIGVICHELGHAFGANDFYDVDYSSNGAFEGTGVWDIMASGSWNNNGVSPANFNPYVKIFDFGWVNPETPEKNGTYSVETYNSSPYVLRIPTSNPSEYFLLEYRDNYYFDEGLPGKGVLIYHVHPQIENKRLSNTINSTHPQCLYPVCASSKFSPLLTSNYGNINSAECPFPGSTLKTEFSNITSPTAFQWDGGILPFSISNMRLADDKAFIDLNFEGNDPNDPTSDETSYIEGFENGLTHFTTEGIEGKANWTTYPKPTLITLTDMPEPYKGTKSLMLYDGTKSGILSKSILTSNNITLDADSIYEFSFWMKTMESPASGTQTFSVDMLNPETYRWDTLYKNSEPIAQWSKITVPLPNSITNFIYRFTGQIFDSGIFIDEVKITGNASTNSVDYVSIEEAFRLINKPLSIISYKCVKIEIFNLNGALVQRRFMLPNETFSPILNKGVYIVCSDVGIKYKVVI